MIKDFPEVKEHLQMAKEHQQTKWVVKEKEILDQEEYVRICEMLLSSRQVSDEIEERTNRIYDNLKKLKDAKKI